jgi:hypothetical protein
VESRNSSYVAYATSCLIGSTADGCPECYALWARSSVWPVMRPQGLLLYSSVFVLYAAIRPQSAASSRWSSRISPTPGESARFQLYGFRVIRLKAMSAKTSTALRLKSEILAKTLFGFKTEPGGWLKTTTSA